MKKIFQLTLLLLAVIFTINLQAQVKKKVVKKPAARTITKKAAPKAAVKPNNPVLADTSETRVKISTDMGDIIVRLSNKTPLHRDNFIKLVNEHFYDSLLFHRVIDGFMIQGGDPQSKNAPTGVMLGMGDVGYTIPAEFDTTLYHKKGALAAARNSNPEKASSGCQFYIVDGKTYNDDQLDMMEQSTRVKYNSAKRMTYKMVGGTPGLDMNYTVFGQVESGLDIITKIATVPKDGNNRPLTDVHMKMEIVKK
jgi:cyclophilin family peptidyl-prolyl cis-trans isomerase